LLSAAEVSEEASALSFSCYPRDTRDETLSHGKWDLDSLLAVLHERCSGEEEGREPAVVVVCRLLIYLFFSFFAARVIIAKKCTKRHKSFSFASTVVLAVVFCRVELRKKAIARGAASTKRKKARGRVLPFSSFFDFVSLTSFSVSLFSLFLPQHLTNHL